MDRTKTTAAAYVRMSTDRQEDSPKQQRAEITKLAARENCEIVAWYEDHGITGDSIDERPQFRRMLADAQKGAFSVILCDNQDRFGRFDSIDAGLVISPLRKAGVRMVTNAQGWINWNDFASRMMFAIQAEGKHQFLHDLSRNVTRSFANSNRPDTFIRSAPLGMCRVFFDQHGKEQARAGAYDEFRCPKGWTVRLAPSDNEQEREAMRWAFETYANTDVGLIWICRGLQARGVLSRAGSRLMGSTLRSLFRNKKYIGIVEAGNFAKGKYHRMNADRNIALAIEVPTRRADHRRGHAVKVFESAGEPLIDRTTFDRVQAKLDRRGLTPRKPRGNRYALSGILRCGHCGGPMSGAGFRLRGTNRVSYYRCNGWHTGKCGGHTVRQDRVETFALDLMRRAIAANAAEIVGEIQGLAKERAEQDAGRQVADQLRRIEGKLERARRNLALAETEDLPTVQAVLDELRAERERLLGELRTAAESSDDVDVICGAAVSLLGTCEDLTSGEPQALKNALVESFESITLRFEKKGKRRYRLASGEVVFRGSETRNGIAT